MDTTIQISKDLLEKLKNLKLSQKESYEDLIWDLIEDRMELSEETKRNIAKSREEIKKGEFVTLAQLKKKYKIN